MNPVHPANVVPFPSLGAPMADETEAAWYVIRSATRRERTAQEALTDRKIAVYMPLGARWGRLRDRKLVISYPLFPGYMFVRCSPRQFRRVLETDGVHDFLCVLNEADEPVPLAVADALVDRIRDEEERGLFDDTRPTKLERARAERIQRGYRKGERVVVLKGVYAGFFSTVIRMTSRNRRAVIEGPAGVLTLDVTDIDPVVADGEKAA